MFASNTALGSAQKQRALCHLLTASTHPSTVPQHIHASTHRSLYTHRHSLAQSEHPQQQQHQQERQFYKAQYQPGVQHSVGTAAASFSTNSTPSSNANSSSNTISSHKAPAVFKFRHFTLQHGGPCAMKMGTDSMLLGAWAQPPEHTAAVLDVGTGSGVLALMMAQKTQQQAAAVHALDIDAASVTQATANAAASPWAHRLSVPLCTLQDWTQKNSHNVSPGASYDWRDVSTNSPDTKGGQTHSSSSSSSSGSSGSSSSSGSSGGGSNRQRYDVIISNPPYFLRSSKPDASHRAAARHADVTLPFADLAQCSAQLLAPGGRLFVVLPVQEAQLFVGEAAAAGLALTRCTQVYMKSIDKQPRRHLMQFEAAAAAHNDVEVADTAVTAADTAAATAVMMSAVVTRDDLVVLVPSQAAAVAASSSSASSSSSDMDAGSSSDGSSSSTSSSSSSKANSSPPAWVFSEQYRQLTVDFHHPDLLT